MEKHGRAPVRQLLVKVGLAGGLPLFVLVVQGLLNSAALAKCKDGVFIVNAGRGGVLVEADLLAALESGKVNFRRHPVAVYFRCGVGNGEGEGEGALSVMSHFVYYFSVLAWKWNGASARACTVCDMLVISRLPVSCWGGGGAKRLWRATPGPVRALCERPSGCSATSGSLPPLLPLLLPRSGTRSLALRWTCSSTSRRRPSLRWTTRSKN